MKHALLILLTLACRWACADAGPEDVVREKCDRLVLNTTYNDRGEINFSQVLFQDWECRHGVWDYYTRAYRIVRNGGYVPRRDWSRNGEYYMLWHDGDVMRCTYAPAFHFLDTQFDPEVLEREIHPMEHRRQLRKPD